MKKNSLKRVFAALSLTAVSASAVTMSASALTGELGEFTQDQADNSTIKPDIYISSVLLDAEGAAGSEVTVSMVINGAADNYAPTGFHIYFDSRLTSVVDKRGNPCIKGDAIADLNIKTQQDPTASEQGMSGFFAATSCDADYGMDGVAWEIPFVLPADAKAGDVYPIDIYYKSSENAKDLFTNVSKNQQGRLMQAYAFTRGINNGETNSWDVATDARDVDGNVIDLSSCPAAANVDPGTDGVIAIAAAETPETTTAPPTTTTTAAPTTTTTAAPTTTTTAAPTTTTTKPATTTTTAAPTTTTTSGATTTTTGVTTSTTSESAVSTTTTTGGTGTTVTGTEGTGTSGTGTAKPSTTVKPSSTAKPATTKAATTTKKDGKDAPQTGVAGVGVAVAGLAVAIGTAFVLRKKED